MAAVCAGVASYAQASPPVADREVVVVAVGDVGLNGDGQRLSERGGFRQGDLIPWDEATRGIAALVDGDLNFANLETVVTTRDDLPAAPRLFTFKMHPMGVRHLIGLGFNAFSTANNHAMDYGRAGADETIRSLDALIGFGLRLHAGLGFSRTQAAAPKLADIRGRALALSAIGISPDDFAWLAREADAPRHLNFRSDGDLTEMVGRLGAAPADYRILSVHHGREFDPLTSSDDRRRLRRAVADGNVDLVVGHHQHVVGGVEILRGRAIFYGLGNFLHLGTQDMSKFDMCRDYGLLARVYLNDGADGRLALRAIEAVPITGMHRTPRPMSPADGRLRIAVVNHLSQMLDDPAAGAVGVRFQPRADGSGLYCAPGVRDEVSRAGRLCATFASAPPVEPKAAAAIASACALKVVRAQPKVEEAGMMPTAVNPEPKE